MMHADILHDVLLFSTRHVLDTVQLVSRVLRDTVDQSTTLPLRYIGCAWLDECSGGCFISGLTEGDKIIDDDGSLHVPSYDPTFATEAGKRDCLRRLNNAFVEDLVVCFACATFLQYLREHAADFVCRISKLSPYCANNNAGAIQHDLAAFVAQKFAPVTYAPELEQDHGLRPQYILLFDHESLRHNIELLELQCDTIEVPIAVLPTLFNVCKLKECHIECCSDSTAWINGYIQASIGLILCSKGARLTSTNIPQWSRQILHEISFIIRESYKVDPAAFEQAVDGLRMITSVTIVLNNGRAEYWRPNILPHGPPRLGDPAHTDLPPPRTAFIEKLLANGLWAGKKERRTQSECELYVFTNALLAKRLHIYKWRIDEEAGAWSPDRTYHHEVTHIVLVDL